MVSELDARDLWRGRVPIRRFLREAVAVRRRMRRLEPDGWLVYSSSVTYPDLFGWWNGGGLGGTEAMVGGLGFRPARPFALGGALAESIGGLLLVLGFLTPVGAAAVIGMMTAATVAVHLPNGMWNTNGGFEFPLVNAAAAAALAFAGPGRLSIDRALGWHLRGTAWGVFAIVLGGLGLLALLGTGALAAPSALRLALTRGGSALLGAATGFAQSMVHMSDCHVITEFMKSQRQTNRIGPSRDSTQNAVARSEHAVRILQEAGFENAVNLEGGIDAWSVEIDPAVPRY